MLKSLYIQNFVLIDNLDIRFNGSLSVVTGETGAGKSIILGALGLVLGQRADARSIKNGAAKCVIEAEFDISSYQLQTLFEEQEMEYDPAICILRRELFANGKSRAFVNDSPVSLASLKELGGRLIDIHSQHQNLLLADQRFQLRVVDILTGEKELFGQYRQTYSSYLSLRKQLVELTDKAIQAKKDEDYIRFQLEQLDEARLQSGEQEELEQEAETLTHAEDIKGGLYRIYSSLHGDDRNGLQYIKEALSTSENLEHYFSKAKEFTERIRSAYIDLNDLATEAESVSEDVEFNPQRLEWVNERLNTIYSLQQKHHVANVDELIGIQDKCREELTRIDSFDEQIEELNSRLEATYKAVCDLGSKVTLLRKKAAQKIEKTLVGMVAPLGMPNTRFQVEFNARKEPTSDGMDEIQFLFSANKSGSMERVSQVASGGEISRLMLCIKAMIAGNTALPSIIFDEVDTGVSGDIADKMGDIMQELGTKMQVITITHLPQIAAKGGEHFYVYKEDQENQTITRIRRLDPDERITEIARMLSGATLTTASIANAKELLKTNKH